MGYNLFPARANFSQKFPFTIFESAALLIVEANAFIFTFERPVFNCTWIRSAVVSDGICHESEQLTSYPDIL